MSELVVDGVRVVIPANPQVERTHPVHSAIQGPLTIEAELQLRYGVTRPDVTTD